MKTFTYVQLRGDFEVDDDYTDNPNWICKEVLMNEFGVPRNCRKLDIIVNREPFDEGETRFFIEACSHHINFTGRNGQEETHLLTHGARQALIKTFDLEVDDDSGYDMLAYDFVFYAKVTPID